MVCEWLVFIVDFTLRVLLCVVINVQCVYSWMKTAWPSSRLIGLISLSSKRLTFQRVSCLRCQVSGVLFAYECVVCAYVCISPVCMTLCVDMCVHIIVHASGLFA